jgi:hypothetical protein
MMVRTVLSAFVGKERKSSGADAPYAYAAGGTSDADVRPCPSVSRKKVDTRNPQERRGLKHFS